MTSVVSYPARCSIWGDSRYRGNCDGRLFKNLVLRYRAERVADPALCCSQRRVTSLAVPV